MSSHRHHAGRAMRLLLTRLHDDTPAGIFTELDAERMLIREVGDCSFCWFLVADQLADMLIATVRARIRDNPRVTEAGIARWLEDLTAKRLDDDAELYADDDDDAA